MPNHNEIQQHIDAVSSFFVQQRMKNKLTQEQVSDKTGIGYTSYQRFEEQKRIPRLNEIMALCHFYEITLLDVALNEAKIRANDQNLTNLEFISAINALPTPIRTAFTELVMELLPVIHSNGHSSSTNGDNSG